MNTKLKFLLLSNAFLVFAGNLLLPVYAIFVLKLGGSVELAGILVGIQFISSFLVSLWVISLKDKSNLDGRMLKVNFLMRSFAWFCVGLWPTISVLLISQIIFGISDGLGAPAFNALVSENLDKKSHIREWGVWELIKNPVIAMASISGGFVATWFGFSFLFFFMAILAFLAFLVYQLINLKMSAK